MKTRFKRVLAAAAVVGFLGAGTGIAIAAGGGDGNDDDATDTPIAAAELDRASAVALAHTGGGRVTETEVGDEESYYEVEVTLDNGDQVDVQLDKNFVVVGSEADHEDGAGNDD